MIYSIVSFLLSATDWTVRQVQELTGAVPPTLPENFDRFGGILYYAPDNEPIDYTS